MRPAGRFVAGILSALETKAAVGVNLLELDDLVHPMINEPARSPATSTTTRFRREPVRRGPVHLGHRRRPAWPPPRLRAPGRRPGLLRFAASVDGWVSDSAFSRRRYAARGGPAPHRGRPPRPRGRHRGGAPGEPAGDVADAIGHVARSAGLVSQPAVRWPRRRPDDARRPPRGERRPPRSGHEPPRRAWSSRSSRGSCTRPTRSTPTPTAGRCAATTAPVAPTWSTRSPITEDGPIVSDRPPRDEALQE